VKLGESFVVSMRALLANRMRSFLTMLGIIIGVAAVICLISVGQGAEKMVSSQIESLGTNLIVITPSKGTTLELADADYLMQKVHLLSRCMPILQFSTDVSWKSNSSTVPIVGTTPNFPQIRSFNVETGRFLMESDLTYRRRVAVVGQTVVEEVFEAQDPIGQVININRQPFTVVGTMEEKGESFGMDNDNIVLAPVTTLQRLAGTRKINSIYAQVRNPENTDTVVSMISKAFDAKFRREDTVKVASQKQLLDTVSTVTSTFTVLLASIAGISLVVGGIGIMNIMLVSVTERTREIGLRKAVGAKNSDILVQFLIESSMLSGFGGIVGIGLGIAASRVIAGLGGWPRYTSLWAISLAFCFSLAVGIFFGLYPAQRAAKLDPIYCLRYE